MDFTITLTLVLLSLSCFNCIFRHLKLELLTQSPAPTDEKYIYFLKIYVSYKLNYLTDWASTTNSVIHFSDIVWLEIRLKPYIYGRGRTRVKFLSQNASLVFCDIMKSNL